MRYVYRALLYLALLGLAAFVAFAYLGDLSPAQVEMSLPVPLDAR